MKKNKKYAGPLKIGAVNSITSLRFLGSFLVLPIFKLFGGVSAAVYSALFMFTDCIDGFLARKLNASTFFGSMFDGVTDKIFVVLTFLLLLSYNPVVFAIPLLMELGIIAVQKNKMKQGLNVKSNFIGKAKTWVLSASMVASLAAVELLDLKPVLDYLKTFSISKIADIKDFLILLGINVPGFVLQALTLKSYKEELDEENRNQEINEQVTIEELLTYSKEELKSYRDKLSLDDQKLFNEFFKDELEEENPEEKLEEIKTEKEKLQQELSLLEKAKILVPKMFDPEYYDKNKDRQIRTLTKELYSRRND